jgi:hypothetical protein
MNMNVSFTGINNIYIGKRASSGYGEYITKDGNIKSGEKDLLDVIIKCDLTDSKRGNHLLDYQNALKKISSYSQVDYVNPDAPRHVELLAQHVNVPNDKDALSFTTFKLNGTEVVLDNPKILPLYTYMAKLTRDISVMPNSTEAQKGYASLVNRYVHDDAVYYIDCVM